MHLGVMPAGRSDQEGVEVRIGPSSFHEPLQDTEWNPKRCEGVELAPVARRTETVVSFHQIGAPSSLGS